MQPVRIQIVPHLLHIWSQAFFICSRDDFEYERKKGKSLSAIYLYYQLVSEPEMVALLEMFFIVCSGHNSLGRRTEFCHLPSRYFMFILAE